MTMFNFTYQTFPHTKARLGILTTPHGVVETPAFIFCATKAAIKGVTPKQMRDAGTQMILSNTYHLMLQPGGETVKKLGGLQKMTNWNGPMLTDSGGFQIFSLGHGSVSSEIKGKRDAKRPKSMLKITEEGAQFKSYIDGKLHLLTPETSIQTQVNLGADLIVVLD
ncbi:MAG: tRNA guanosine(34) transglycosylase Tgt, partial [Alphaproteobacteria bacterium]|nr:tRNA guanosine(34) transglycosylase Tgt [Alphaproteobacteria bacterium]